MNSAICQQSVLRSVFLFGAAGLDELPTALGKPRSLLIQEGGRAVAGVCAAHSVIADAHWAF